MSERMTRPVQKALKLPATKPDRTLSDAPPCLEALVTSETCLDDVLVKTLVNSGISAPASVPQEMMIESTHQRSGCALPAASLKSPSSSLLATKVTTMETTDVIQTRFVNGCSQ